MLVFVVLVGVQEATIQFNVFSEMPLMVQSVILKKMNRVYYM